MTTETKAIQHAIDDFVAKGGHPAVVLHALAEACWATEEHVQSSWQEEETAGVWRKLGRELDAKADAVQKTLKGIGY